MRCIGHAFGPRWGWNCIHVAIVIVDVVNCNIIVFDTLVIVISVVCLDIDCNDWVDATAAGLRLLIGKRGERWS